MRQRQQASQRVRYSKARRRILVATLYLVVAATVFVLPAAAMASTVGLPQRWGLVLLLVAPPVLLAFISAAVGGFNPRTALLDERERAQRDRATAVAYRLLAAAVILTTVYAIGASTQRVDLPVPSTPGQLFVFLIPIYFLALSLPIAVLAWTLPDPDPEPESDAEGS
jgi:hypothetical protein